MIKEFIEKEIDFKNLLLDPNNPRFSRHRDEETPEDLIGDEDIQKKAYKEMFNKRNNFEIEDLANAIKSKGFYAVDKIFVKKIKNKYLVVEGNRRITAIKYLLEKNKEGRRGDRLSDKVLSSFKIMKCVDLTGVDDDEVNLILGLRHHGSIKEWRPLPSAFNLFNRYMKEYCQKYDCGAEDPKNFKYEQDITDFVKNIYSIKRTQVREQVLIYRAYLQVRESLNSDENIHQEDKFSIIGDTIKSKPLREHFDFDMNYGVFSEEGLELFLDICIGVNGKEPVITAAASGESNLRDYAYVVSNGTPEHVRRIEEDRVKSSDVKAAVKSKEFQLDLLGTLKIIVSAINKIKLGDIKQGLADEEKDLIKKFEKKLKQLKKAAGDKK